MRNSSESIFFFFLDNQAESHANIVDAASLMFVLAARLINVTLAANLVLMAKMYHWILGQVLLLQPMWKAYEFIINIHSLRNKLDELR